MSKESAFRLTSVFAGFAMALLALEIVFRLLPTSTGLRSQPVTKAHPIAHFEPNLDFLWSRDWDFKYATRGHINNAGFVNDEDYDPELKTPLLAIIGDSYIEAATVPHRDTIQGRLSKQLRGRGRVYSFAKAGAPLSQYLVWAEFVRRTYRPDGLVISVVSNDFDESLLRYQRASGKPFPGFFYFERVGRELELQLSPYRPSRLRKLIRYSALARYLFFNLRVGNIRLDALIDAVSEARLLDVVISEAQAQHIADTHPYHRLSAADLLQRESLSRLAVDTFLREMPQKAGLAPAKIVIAVDALRAGIYEPPRLSAASASYFGKMRAYLIAQARQAGFEVVDLQGPMTREFEIAGKRMEFQHDWHWSEVGHGVVADEVAKTTVFRSVFPDAVRGRSDL